MLAILQTLILLFGIAFILGFLSRDLQAIFNPPKSVTDSTPPGTPEPATGSIAGGEAIASPPEAPKST